MMYAYARLNIHPSSCANMLPTAAQIDNNTFPSIKLLIQQNVKPKCGNTKYGKPTYGKPKYGKPEYDKSKYGKP